VQAHRFALSDVLGPDEHHHPGMRPRDSLRDLRNCVPQRLHVGRIEDPQRATEQERQELRELIEIKASGIRHFRILDSRLHMTIARAAHNESLLPIIEKLRSEFFLWADAAWTRLDWSVLSSPEQDFGYGHRSLVLAITEGRKKESHELMREHIEHGLGQVKAVIARVGPGGTP
jgi:DNA-binding GntR family transcriptional regulator